MALKFKNGDIVRQIVPVISGTVVDKRLVGDDVQFEVEYTGADGETHRRFFAENDIEPVPVESAQ